MEEADGPAAGQAGQDEARRFFEAIASRYDRAYALPRDASRARMARVLAELARAGSGARVLDLGVGTGRELSALQDAGYAPTGLDFSAKMLALCNKRARPVPLVEASFWAPLPFPAASFDAALALHGTLAHPPDDGAVARLAAELARVLVPGGLFVAEVPSPAWLDELDAASLPDRRARRTGERRGEYEDTVTGARIEARLFDAGEWRAALAAHFDARVEATSRAELLVVANARR